MLELTLILFSLIAETGTVQTEILWLIRGTLSGPHVRMLCQGKILSQKGDLI